MAGDTAPQDLSEFDAYIVQHGPRCGVRKILDRLEPEDRAKLEAALAAQHIPHSALSRWCRDKGHILGQDAFGRHRKGECACDRAT